MSERVLAVSTVHHEESCGSPNDHDMSMLQRKSALIWSSSPSTLCTTPAQATQNPCTSPPPQSYRFVTMWIMCSKVLSCVWGSRSFSREHFRWLDLSTLPQLGWVPSPKVTFNVPWMDLTVDLCCQKAFLFSSRNVVWQHLGLQNDACKQGQMTNESHETCKSPGRTPLSET